MKKAIIVILVILLAGGGFLTWKYMNREWVLVSSGTAYYYEETAGDENISKDTSESEMPSSFPLFLEDYYMNSVIWGGASLLETDEEGKMLSYKEWLMQCDNKLIDGEVSLYLFDENGEVLFEQNDISRSTGSLEWEMERDLIERCSWIVVQEKGDATLGEVTVMIYGK